MDTYSEISDLRRKYESVLLALDTKAYVDDKGRKLLEELKESYASRIEALEYYKLETITKAIRIIAEKAKITPDLQLGKLSTKNRNINVSVLKRKTASGEQLNPFEKQIIIAYINLLEENILNFAIGLSDNSEDNKND